MEIERHYIYGDIDDSSLESLLKDKIPNNSWIISKNIPFVKQYLSYVSIQNELEYINTLVSKLIDIRIKERDLDKTTDDTDFWLKKSLYQSIIIGYSRCFNSTKKNGRISINEKFIRKDFPKHPSLSIENTIKFHKKLLEIRNKYIAHADNSMFEKTLAFIEFSYDEKYLDSKFNHVTVGTYSFDEDELTNLILLIAWLLKKIKKKKSLLIDKIKDEITNDGLMQIGIMILKKNN